MKTLGAALVLSCLLAGAGLAPAQVAHAGTSRADDPAVGSPEYVARDTQNIADAYGRITDQQLGDPAYLPALVQQGTAVGVAQLLEQAATPDRPSVTPGAFVPGWNVGNPFRATWDGTRGRMREVSFTNRYGALLRGPLYAPLPRARDPYTGKRITGRLPGVVITEGSVQGSEGMYRWLAQDLAERGSTPHAPYPDHGAGDLVDAHNPWHRRFDRRPDRRPNAAGRTTRIAIIGHSLGAAAVTQVQGTDERVSTVVALDKLGLSTSSGTDAGDAFDPVVPALAVQSEYGFTVGPWFAAGGSSITPQPSPQGPDPRRERATGYDVWRDAGVDSMLVVPRASTHLEYTDIPLVLPASRWGQALTSAYVQRWLEHYLKHRTSVRTLLATKMRYLEPTSTGEWAPVVLRRDPLLSFYYCSAMHLGRGAIDDGDLTDVGC